MLSLNDFFTDWHSETPTLMVHTSGSTGRPKPLQVEKSKMLASARMTCDFLGLKPGDTALLCMSLDYIAGKMMVVRSLERRLQLLTVTPDGHPMATFRQKYPLAPVPTFVAMVPMQVYNTLQMPQERELLMQVRHLIIGGGAIDDSLERALKEFPHAVWSTYGMTETLSHIALRRLSGTEADTWYRPFKGVEVSLAADGCLVIDAPLVHDGALKTNDRACIDPQKGFRILGRKDNVIDSGGIKIQIEEVEQALQQCLQAPYMVTRRPDAKFGEIVVLLTEQTDLSQVAKACTAVLPRYWRPRLYLHVDHIPLTATGKPARAEAERLAR